MIAFQCLDELKHNYLTDASFFAFTFRGFAFDAVRNGDALLDRLTAFDFGFDVLTERFFAGAFLEGHDFAFFTG